MVNQLIKFRKTLKLAQGYAIFCSQNPHILIVMFAVLNLKYGVMRTKRLAPTVALNGNAQTIMPRASHTVNMQINAEQ